MIDAYTIESSLIILILFLLILCPIENAMIKNNLISVQISQPLLAVSILTYMLYAWLT